MIISAHSQGVKDATNGAILKAKSIFIYGLYTFKNFMNFKAERDLA